MDGGELLDILDDLGWTKAEFSRRLGLHQNTVYDWAEVPRYAVAYLELKIAARAMERL